MRIGNQPAGTVGVMAGVWAVPTDWAWSFAQMVQYNAEAMCAPGQYVHYARATVSYHSFARNSLVEQMEGDWLLMLDTDHAFEPDIAVRMVHRMNAAGPGVVDVLTGVYPFKGEPYRPVLFHAEEPGRYLGVSDWRVPEGGLLRVSSAGAGCLLVRRSVFERIERELGEPPFLERDGMSEDHSFFRRLEILGIPAWCDVRIESPHLTARKLTMADYDRGGVDEADLMPAECVRA